MEKLLNLPGHCLFGFAWLWGFFLLIAGIIGLVNPFYRSRWVPKSRIGAFGLVTIALFLIVILIILPKPLPLF